MTGLADRMPALGDSRLGAAMVAAVAGGVTTFLLSWRLDRSFNFDEAVNVEAVIQRGSAWAAINGTETFNNHPVFAVGQSVWWALGGDGEARQRLLPVLYGIAAVTLLCWWVSRRLGALAGASAGAVFALNPMFISQARSVRGYSLVVLCVVVATICLIEFARHDDRRHLAPYVLAMICALGTHPFAGVPLGAISLAVVAYQRRLHVEVVAAWCLAAGGTLLVYLPAFDDLRASVGARGSRYLPWAARTTTSELLGRDTITAWLVGALLAVALATLVMRRDLRWPAITVVGLVVGQFLLVWQVVRPFDLYPRFFLGLLPFVAIGVGCAVRHQRWLCLVAIAAMVFTLGNVDEERTRNVPIRETASVVETGRRLGLEPCIVGGGPIRLYAVPPRELIIGGEDVEMQLEGCDLVIRIGSWGAPLLAPARLKFANEGRIDGRFEIFADVPLALLGSSVTSK